MLNQRATTINLRGADLREIDLSGADLSGADLRNADLSGASLFEANLHQADLRGATLTRADLLGANLYDARIDEITQIDEKWRLIWAIVNQENDNGEEDFSLAVVATLSGANLFGSHKPGTSNF